MIAHNKMFFSIESLRKEFDRSDGEAKIAKVVNDVVRANRRIPAGNHLFVHFFDAMKGAAAISNDIGAIEMVVGIEEDHRLTLA